MKHLTLLRIMTQITARLPDELVAQIDEVASSLRRSRAEVVRQALEYYLEDLKDLRLGLAKLQDPADEILDWGSVRDELLSQD